MDPITPVITLVDKTEELLGHSPHPAVVGLPIGAWAVSNVCDGLAMLTGDCHYDDTARISMAVGLVGAAGAVVTGLRDYSYIHTDSPSHGIATTHGIGNAVVGVLFTTSYLMRVRDHAEGRRTCLASRLLGLAGGGLALYTAWLGGKLVEEYGEAVKPVMEHQRQNEEEGEERAVGQETHGRRRLSQDAPLGVHGQG
jgi:uncharacterized membrane protein